MDYISKYEQLPSLYFVNKYKGLVANIENKDFLRKDILLSQRANDLTTVISFARINLQDSICMIDNRYRQYIYALNSLLWYNSCFDYVWQYAYFDKVATNVTDKNYENLLKKTHPFSTSEEKVLLEYTALMELREKLHALRNFANKLKHRLPIFDIEKQNGIAFFNLGSANPNSIIGYEINWDSKFSSEDSIVHDPVKITTIWDMLFQADKDIYSFYLNEIISSHSSVQVHTDNL